MALGRRLSRENLDLFTSMLKALAHPVRLMIAEELLRNPRCVSAIHELLEVQQPNISQHLTVLKGAGIVGSSRDGSYRCYYLLRPGLVEAVLEALSTSWPEVGLPETKVRFRAALAERQKKSGKSG